MKLKFLLGLICLCGITYANSITGVYNCQDTDNNENLNYQTELTINQVSTGVYSLLEREHLHPSDPLHTYNHVALLQGNMLASAWQNQKDLKEVGVEIFQISGDAKTLTGNWVNLRGGRAISNEVCVKQ